MLPNLMQCYLKSHYGKRVRMAVFSMFYTLVKPL